MHLDSFPLLLSLAYPLFITYGQSSKSSVIISFNFTESYSFFWPSRLLCSPCHKPVLALLVHTLQLAAAAAVRALGTREEVKNHHHLHFHLRLAAQF